MNLWTPAFWQILASIATIVGVFVVIYAAKVAVDQLREMARARQLEALREVFDHLETLEARALRRFVYGLTSEPGALSEEDQAKVEQAIASFDNIGALIKYGLISQDIMIPFYYDIILKCWKRLGPYLRYEREKRGTKKYGANFELLAKLSEEYRAKHFPEEEIKIY